MKEKSWWGSTQQTLLELRNIKSVTFAHCTLRCDKKVRSLLLIISSVSAVRAGNYRGKKIHIMHPLIKNAFSTYLIQHLFNVLHWELLSFNRKVMHTQDCTEVLITGSGPEKQEKCLSARLHVPFFSFCFSALGPSSRSPTALQMCHQTHPNDTCNGDQTIILLHPGGNKQSGGLEWLKTRGEGKWAVTEHSQLNHRRS